MKTRRTFRLAVFVMVLLIQFFPASSMVRLAAAAVYCDQAQFVADVTIPDGTGFSAGAVFVKTWQLKNIGSCAWTGSYAAVFYSGNQMGAPAAVSLPASVAPGATVDITVTMTAPVTPGHYRSYWKLRNAAGTKFGLGVYRTGTFFADINVTGSSKTTLPATYDFVANYCSAAWSSGAGALPCPGAAGDVKGYVLKVDLPVLETGAKDANPGLSVAPQKVAGGYIQGSYPDFTIQAGDRFQSIVNCAYQAWGCYVNFRLLYQVGTGPAKVLWNFNERYEGSFYRTDVDLSPLAGQTVRFILYMSDVSGRGVLSADRALWGGARIVRPDSTPAPTAPTPTTAPQTTSTLTATTVPQTATTPTLTTAPQPTSAPLPTVTPLNCDMASFVADVTIPDGAVIPSGAAFTKTWRIKNAGSCTWTTAYAAVFYNGNQLGAPSVVNFPSDVPPGTTVDITVNMTAPSTSGHYFSYWKLRNAAGVQFGLGANRTGAFFVEINVPGVATPTIAIVPTSTFGPNACTPVYNPAFEAQMIALINNERAKVGLAPLAESSALDASARGHSVDMSVNNFMSHNGSDGSTYWVREVSAGYTGRWGGEIIYAGSGSYNSPESAVTWWMNDQPHQALIVADYQDVGAGYAYCSTSNYGAYFTVDFGHR